MPTAGTLKRASGTKVHAQKVEGRLSLQKSPYLSEGFFEEATFFVRGRFPALVSQFCAGVPSIHIERINTHRNHGEYIRAKGLGMDCEG